MYFFRAGLLATLASVVSVVHGEGLYSKDSAVLQLNEGTFNKLIKKSNTASVSFS